MDGVIDRIEWYEAILAEDPASGVFADLAELFLEDGRYEDALSVCRRGLEAHPYHLRGQLSLALALFHLDRREEAEELFRRLRGELSAFSKLFATLAMIAVESGAGDEAERLLRIAQALEDRKAPIHTPSRPQPAPEPPPPVEEAAPAPAVPPSPPAPRLPRVLQSLLQAVEKRAAALLDAADSRHPGKRSTPLLLFDEGDRELLRRCLLGSSVPM